MEANTEELERKVGVQAEKIKSLIAMMERRLVGQSHVSRSLAIAMVARGHVLLEGLPGLAKTTAVKALSDASDLDMNRIQFTPDLLPADVVGTQIYDPKSGSFYVKKGPVFTNLVIADEINRAPAKVQSALLEAMQEGQVTIGDETYKLAEPFLVMATQNPIEQEGTYPLPEAQMDRFLFKIKVGYTTMEEEEEIVSRMSSGEEIPLESVISGHELMEMRELVKSIHVADKIRKYIVQVVFATREPAKFGLDSIQRYIEVGASPRASINLEKAARVQAMIQGRTYVVPQDVKDVGLDVLRHRVILTYEAEAEQINADQVVQKIFDGVDVP